jgi:hypothetical protein
MATLMQECLRKGLPFHMVVLEDNLQALRPQGLLSNYNRPSWLDNSNALIPRGHHEPANTCILQDYLHNVTAVLQHPHAHCFLTTGNLLWRIAITLALLPWDALMGPSSTASVYGRHSPPVQNNLIDDQTSSCQHRSRHSLVSWSCIKASGLPWNCSETASTSMENGALQMRNGSIVTRGRF